MWLICMANDGVGQSVPIEFCDDIGHWGLSFIVGGQNNRFTV